MIFHRIISISHMWKAESHTALLTETQSKKKS